MSYDFVYDTNMCNKTTSVNVALIKEFRPCLLCLLRAELFVSLALGLILQFGHIHSLV